MRTIHMVLVTGLLCKVYSSKRQNGRTIQCCCPSGSDHRRGIRGTQVEPSIQDIVDEVAPIKEAPLWG